MQPERSGLAGDPEGDVFLRQLEAPLRYLRGLGAEPGAQAADAKDGAGALQLGAQADAGERGAAGGPEASVIKRLEGLLGFAPVLDLPGGGEPAFQLTLSEERYSVEGELGSGGMGKVLLVYDQDIRRRVAMKVLREEARDSKAITRFIEEAQATGQLEHPNIAPVYDLGIDRSGRVFFTMKLVRGRNLREILRDLSIGRLETRRHFTLTRLIQILQQASMGVHYAHVRGVIHRDLKPDNVMVGDFGEVLVMDWGLAKITSRPDNGPVSFSEPVESHRRDSGQLTVDGTIQGTLVYMSPEQARGWVDEIDERSDVFGLGAILYEILTFRPPYEGKSAREILALAGVGSIQAPRLRAPRNSIPPSLEEICLKALAPSKEERYPDAKAFHEALQVYLDGSAEAQRRAQEAAQLVRQGREKVRDYERLAAVEDGLRGQAKEALSKLAPHQPAEEKVRGWNLEDEAARVRQQRIRSFNEATSLLHSAINIDESCSAARETLANLYWNRFEEAERAGNADDMLIYRDLVERYHQGAFTEVLEGKGVLQVHSEPPGAEVTLSRIVESGRRLAEQGAEACGTTPLRLELPIGNHLLILRKPGCRDTRYPVSMERCARLTAKINLYGDAEIGAGFIHVPAGEVLLGGDAAAPGSLEASHRYVSDVFIGEHPVTFEEYCRFLDDLRAANDQHLAEMLPHTEKEGACVELGEDGKYRPLEKLVDSPTRERYAAGFERRLPVLAVSWFAASRYCEWLSQRTGRRVRLVRDLEWEKAARGVARSVYPWGNFFDWSLVKGGLSRPEYPQPEPVGAFPTDRSIYGIADLSGSIREWCDDWFIEGAWRLTRGGCWSSMNEATFRAAFRIGVRPIMKSSAIGFRVAAEPRRRG
jgi:serine/threonine protein kinase/formylglycine-generating enzyme required for sulfatase activity